MPRVSAVDPIVEQTTACGLCSERLTASDVVAVCPVCSVIYHATCWHTNQLSCARLGCAGAGLLHIQADATTLRTLYEQGNLSEDLNELTILRVQDLPPKKSPFVGYLILICLGLLFVAMLSMSAFVNWYTTIDAVP